MTRRKKKIKDMYNEARETNLCTKFIFPKFIQNIGFGSLYKEAEIHIFVVTISFLGGPVKDPYSFSIITACIMPSVSFCHAFSNRVSIHVLQKSMVREFNRLAPETNVVRTTCMQSVL